MKNNKNTESLELFLANYVPVVIQIHNYKLFVSVCLDLVQSCTKLRYIFDTTRARDGSDVDWVI